MTQPTNTQPSEEAATAESLYKLAGQLRHERDQLGQALGHLLVALGVIERAPMTGPDLLAAAAAYTASLPCTNAQDE